MATLSRTPMSSKKPKVTHASSEWTLASDDAWDSASDSESAYKPPLSASSSRMGVNSGNSNHRSPSPGGAGVRTLPSKPIPVTGPTAVKGVAKGLTKSPSGTESTATGSQSSISFSYTHVETPSPSSSYGRQGVAGKGPGTGWTMVTSPLSSSTYGTVNASVDGPDVEVENEVEVDADGGVTELGSGGIGLSRNRRIKEGKEAIKYDVEEIVNGLSVYWNMNNQHLTPPNRSPARGAFSFHNRIRGKSCFWYWSSRTAASTRYAGAETAKVC